MNKDVMSYNVGNSDYSKREIQPWDIWDEYNLDPWDADIIKRVLRNKDGQSRREDYEKIIHVAKKQIDRIDKGVSLKADPRLYNIVLTGHSHNTGTPIKFNANGFPIDTPKSISGLTKKADGIIMPVAKRIANEVDLKLDNNSFEKGMDAARKSWAVKKQIPIDLFRFLQDNEVLDKYVKNCINLGKYSLPVTLASAFDWAASPQGIDFWSELYDKFVGTNEDEFDETDEDNFKLVPEPHHSNSCRGCYFDSSACPKFNSPSDFDMPLCSERESIWVRKDA